MICIFASQVNDLEATNLEYYFQSLGCIVHVYRDRWPSSLNSNQPCTLFNRDSQSTGFTPRENLAIYYQQPSVKNVNDAERLKTLLLQRYDVNDIPLGKGIYEVYYTNGQKEQSDLVLILGKQFKDKKIEYTNDPPKRFIFW